MARIDHTITFTLQEVLDLLLAEAIRLGELPKDYRPRAGRIEMSGDGREFTLRTTAETLR